jgi:hypothetical protein
MAAAAVAAGMLLTPAPASAKLTFGRAADVAEQQVSCSKGLDEDCSLEGRKSKT